MSSARRGSFSLTVTAQLVCIGSTDTWPEPATPASRTAHRTLSVMSTVHTLDGVFTFAEVLIDNIAKALSLRNGSSAKRTWHALISQDRGPCNAPGGLHGRRLRSGHTLFHKDSAIQGGAVCTHDAP